MQRLVALVLAACTLAGIVGQSAVAQDRSLKRQQSRKAKAAQPAEAGFGDFIVGDPVRCQNLTVFPVTSKVPKNEDRYLTLDEGLKSGEVQIFEVGAVPGAARRPASDSSASVNRLMLLNRSDKPLYLMPGDVIYGGQQDRTIGEEAVIPPGKKPVAIQVFCVEHGRWSARDDSETSQALVRLAAPSAQPLDAKARQKLAEEAKQGKFVAHAGSLSKGGRAAVQEGKGQQEVWDKIGEANASSGAQSASDAFTANYTNPELLKRLQAYLKGVEQPVAGQQQVVGAIVAINGKVEAVDVFQSTPLFEKVWPRLVKSHALDASAVAQRPDAEKLATVSDASEFFRTAMQAKVEKKSKSRGGLVVTKRDSEKVESFSAGFGSAGDAFGDSVHSSAYKK